MSPCCVWENWDSHFPYAFGRAAVATEMNAVMGRWCVRGVLREQVTGVKRSAHSVAADEPQGVLAQLLRLDAGSVPVMCLPLTDVQTRVPPTGTRNSPPNVVPQKGDAIPRTSDRPRRAMCVDLHAERRRREPGIAERRDTLTGSRSRVVVVHSASALPPLGGAVVVEAAR